MPADPWCCEPTILLNNMPLTLGNMRANSVRMLAVWPTASHLGLSLDIAGLYSD
jgi:hypothetical protein